MIHKLTKGDGPGFVQVSNAALADKNISLKAKGLLAFMLSKPVDWTFYIGSMSAELKEGKEAIAGALNELIEYGYVERNELRGEDNRFTGIEYVVWYFPQAGNPVTGTPISGNPAITNKEGNKQRHTNISLAIHETLNLPMQEGRYKSLCDQYGESVVMDYMQRAKDYADAHGKPYKDYAAAASAYIRKDAKRKLDKSDTDTATLMRSLGVE